MKKIAKKDFHNFITTLINDSKYKVEGVQAKGEKFVFNTLETVEDLRLDYDTTILPPKKYFLPQYETLMEYTVDNPFKEYKTAAAAPTLVLIGVHPYDIIALKQTDAYFLDTDVSGEYLEKRKNTIVIGSNVQTVGEKAFFGAMGTGEVDSGYDLFITDTGDYFVIDVGSQKGEDLLKKARGLQEASSTDIQQAEKKQESAIKQATRDLQVKPSGWYDLLEKNVDSSVWKEQSEKCLACGTCTMVCPTCFCYDVQDTVEIDLDHGQRIRTWDGCLLRGFTEVASGEVFREEVLDRYRHRFFRKGAYLPDKLEFVACVGCGRCSSQCVPDIADPVQVMNKLVETSSATIKEKKVSPTTIKIGLSDVTDGTQLHKPLPATIKTMKKLTDNEMFFEIELDSKQSLCHEPGQFVEVSIAGIGEAPISLASAPSKTSFDLVVRKLGDVTSALHNKKPGDKIGIRGPFGRGFDIDEMKGKDIVIIGAGIGMIPLRSLIHHIIDPKYRKEYGKITILYGCKEPCELLFGDEVEQWDKREDIDHFRTVDRCPEGVCWEGDIGLITALIPKVKMNAKKTIAVIVGPPIVYKFCIDILLKAGIQPANIVVSLERRMKCGVGKCGHCQINHLYVCKDGPVFTYEELKDIPEAFA
jgi:sulfite reductase subunit B